MKIDEEKFKRLFKDKPKTAILRNYELVKEFYEIQIEFLEKWKSLFELG